MRFVARRHGYQPADLVVRSYLALVLSAVLLSCTVVEGGGDGDGLLTARPPDPARLVIAPEAPARDPVTPGLQPLGLSAPRDGLLYLPAGYEPGRTWPLVVMLHGAGGDPRGGLDPFLRLADERGLILLAPASRDHTWDVIRAGYGPDVRAVDQALGRAFSRYNVDRSRLAIAGFSDGASYALSLGMANGDLFTHVIAFSPGFAAPGTRRGGPERPRLFITHGRSDNVLPIDGTSRPIVRNVEREGYHVSYQEFDGGHFVPPELAEEAVRWLLEGR